MPLSEVKENFRRYGLDDDQVRFLPGWFRDTLPALSEETFAVVRLDGDMMMQEFLRGGPVMHSLLRYTQALITQMSQTAVCNRYHTVDQQLCRWLLLSLDRLQSNELVMTQELIANMLGVRREGVTEAAGRLHKTKIIRYQRGRITVLDRLVGLRLGRA